MQRGGIFFAGNCGGVGVQYGKAGNGWRFWGWGQAALVTQTFLTAIVHNTHPAFFPLANHTLPEQKILRSVSHRNNFSRKNITELNYSKTGSSGGIRSNDLSRMFRYRASLL